ncbi:hypothetical protein GLOIN_2v1770419 [Rhizophagus irregularis DAOM 181602=DAOM 197198]|uniref:RNase H type-1 domain-containing protein n=1 Tax=Rhizophagus irregularis (strain DAOM 181602 / DAOM 197198 / MUCL 43194) TaxID=747089 RepID=A0A2P4QC58_RHIID|nr:hypothetical protein GLOIN_2v1770419 [Rhizophagus irregularis DAOM 181602=DAOM 197198]POG75216.1 hypothetical protein GLOIN_2v1770419 [Rhizophagus irregularis DAOM 181602=DAOM 197198]|eukprot:XP_025182082.1 hypothetical protein GLOIN_2v1770419 [Rhizophagus irregularis DAOM 181602=DAOM 197198]
MKSHKKDMLSVEIWNIASFDPHLGNLYQLEKPARSLTLDIPRKSARTLNMEAQSHCTNDDSSPTSISESIEYSESDIASTPAIVIDQDRLIDIRFGSSDLAKTLMDAKKRLLTLSQLKFYTDGSLKKRSHGSIIDSNARSNIKWDPNTNEAPDREILVRNNFLLLYRIFRVVRKGNLDLEHKVKGHSGYIWNEKVDELAKLASTSPSTQFNLAHDDINFLPTIDNIKNMIQFFNDAQWTVIKMP